MQGFWVCKWKRLQDEADTEFVDFRITRGIGGQQVEINLGTGGEDEPTALGADAGINTELVELGTFGSLFREIESGGNTNIPAMVIVLVDVAELDGNEDSAVLSRLLFAGERVEGDTLVHIGLVEEGKPRRFHIF